MIDNLLKTKPLLVTAAASVVSLFGTVSSAEAITFRTTLTFSPAPSGMTSVVFDWEIQDSDATRSAIGKSDLISFSGGLEGLSKWNFSFVPSFSEYYGEVESGLWDFEWYDGNGLSRFFFGPFDGSFPNTYQEFDFNLSGTNDEWFYRSAVQNTIILEGPKVVDTPEPSLILGFIALGGLMLGSTRKAKS
ncbi:MAG: hypothetical protein WBA93_06385 [Microcoleaceae cyanobacterium]